MVVKMNCPYCKHKRGSYTQKGLKCTRCKSYVDNGALKDDPVGKDKKRLEENQVKKPSLYQSVKKLFRRGV